MLARSLTNKVRDSNVGKVVQTSSHTVLPVIMKQKLVRERKALC